MAARDRVFARHPKTQFLVAARRQRRREPRPSCRETLDRFPNMTVELGRAHRASSGRQPRASRQFFDKYQDRILFGTDAVPPPSATSTRSRSSSDELYEIYYRFLGDRGRDTSTTRPRPCRPQGRWRIYGIGLPDDILKKVYEGNAVRFLGLARVIAATLIGIALAAGPMPAEPQYVVASTRAEARRAVVRRRRGLEGRRAASTGGRRPTRRRVRGPVGGRRGCTCASTRAIPRPWHHDDPARRAPLGRGGRGGLPRPRPLRPELRRVQRSARATSCATCGWSRPIRTRSTTSRGTWKASRRASCP